MILLARVFAIILTIIVLGKAILDYKKGRESFVMLAFWLLSWISILFFAIKPDYLFWINDHVGGENSGIGTFLGMAFMFLFFVTYRVYVKANRLEKQLRDIVMKLGLEQLDEIS